MSQPQPQPAPQPVVILCPECGEMIEVKDPEAMIRALHLVNECAAGSLLRSQG